MDTYKNPGITDVAEQRAMGYNVRVDAISPKYMVIGPAKKRRPALKIFERLAGSGV